MTPASEGLCAALLLYWVAGAQAAEPVAVGAEKQLFLDGLLVAKLERVALTMNPPRKTGEANLVPDRLWEGHRICAYGSVFEDEGVFRMYYDAIANDGSRWLCYATSKDGLRWEKPDLGLVEFGGTKRTNILFPPQRAPFEPGCVFRDTNPACPPDQRYKAVVSYQPPGGHEGTWVLGSADGLRFAPLGDGPCFGSSDTGNVAFWDDRIGKYACYCRMWEPTRKVGRCETADLTDWGQAQTVFGADDHDPPGIDFYTNAAAKYPFAANAYFLFPSMYFHYPEPPVGKYRNDGPLDIRLAVSRDGIKWSQVSRKPFVPCGIEGSRDDSALYLLTGMLRRGPELWMYYAGYDFTHGAYNVGADRNKGVISRLVQRLDGFVSADAEYEGGTLTTVPITFAGKRLELNCETGVGGAVQVELRGEDGKPRPGFALTDADPLRGDSVAKTVTWKGQSDVSRLAGQVIVLHFRMRDAKLYAFQFQE